MLQGEVTGSKANGTGAVDGGICSAAYLVVIGVIARPRMAMELISTREACLGEGP